MILFLHIYRLQHLENIKMKCIVDIDIYNLIWAHMRDVTLSTQVWWFYSTGHKLDG